MAVVVGLPVIKFALCVYVFSDHVLFACITLIENVCYCELGRGGCSQRDLPASGWWQVVRGRLLVSELCVHTCGSGVVLQTETYCFPVVEAGCQFLLMAVRECVFRLLSWDGRGRLLPVSSSSFLHVCVSASPSVPFYKDTVPLD